MRQLGGDGANTSLAVTAFGGDMIKALHWVDAPQTPHFNPSSWKSHQLKPFHFNYLEPARYAHPRASLHGDCEPNGVFTAVRSELVGQNSWLALFPSGSQLDYNLGGLSAMSKPGWSLGIARLWKKQRKN